MTNSRALIRPREDRVVAGVCAGLAAYLGWPTQRVRIAYVILSVLSAAFPGILTYLVLWYLMPEDDAPRRRPFRLDDPAA
jgi:phage shock protein C